MALTGPPSYTEARNEYSFPPNRFKLTAAHDVQWAVFFLCLLMACVYLFVYFPEIVSFVVPLDLKTCIVVTMTLTLFLCVFSSIFLCFQPKWTLRLCFLLTVCCLGSLIVNHILSSSFKGAMMVGIIFFLGALLVGGKMWRESLKASFLKSTILHLQFYPIAAIFYLLSELLLISFFFFLFFSSNNVSFEDVFVRFSILGALYIILHVFALSFEVTGHILASYFYLKQQEQTQVPRNLFVFCFKRAFISFGSICLAGFLSPLRCFGEFSDFCKYNHEFSHQFYKTHYNNTHNFVRLGIYGNKYQESGHRTCCTMLKHNLSNPTSDALFLNTRSIKLCISCIILQTHYFFDFKLAIFNALFSYILSGAFYGVLHKSFTAFSYCYAEDPTHLRKIDYDFCIDFTVLIH